MQRGTQGHVAEPREPRRALAWRRGDMYARYIFIYYILLYSIGIPIIGTR